jgi:hypothetical protein
MFTEPELQIANPVNTGNRVSQLRLARERRYPWLSPPTLSFLKRLHGHSTLSAPDAFGLHPSYGLWISWPGREGSIHM